MSPSTPPDPMGFLSDDPTPVGPDEAADPRDVLPQSVADELMRIPGAEGAWIERTPEGSRIVILHVSRIPPPFVVPRTVVGLPVRVIDGGVIRAQD